MLTTVSRGKLREAARSSLAVALALGALYAAARACEGAKAYGVLFERPACISPVIGPQALPWLNDMRGRYLVGCK